MFKTQFKIIKASLLFLLFINLAACSYSPTSLKETYNDLASELSEELKEPFNMSAQQSAMVDNYTKELIHWHRRNKLPEYSQTFSRLALLVKQDDISLPLLQNILLEIDEIPHFEQASHLSYQMLAVAKSLIKTQISQLELSFNNAYQQESLAIRNKNFTSEVNDDIKTLFRFIGIHLGADQLKIVKQETKNFHDIRKFELEAEKHWNQQLITLLRQKNTPYFDSLFNKLWNAQDPKLTGKANQLKQQNMVLMAKLMKKLIMSFTADQKENLSKQLTSISNTFNEMVYE